MTLETLLEGTVILIDKPYSWTSFQVVKKIKSAIKKQYGISKIKVGHAGTLDPLATGLLLVCIGKETKQIEKYQAGEKEYDGTFVLGATTPSFDLELPINETYPIAHISSSLLKEAALNFIGQQEQIPPVFSAVKIDGKRAFSYARNQEEVEIQPKTIHIREFDITDWDSPNVGFRIVCGKGTYIRSIARDLGKALGSGAHVSSLRRTRIGDFLLQDAMVIDQIDTFFVEES